MVCTGSEEQDRKIDTMKSCSGNIATKSVTVAPFGTVQEVSCKDDYKVPSQMQGEYQGTSQDEIDFKSTNDCYDDGKEVKKEESKSDDEMNLKSTHDTYHDFMNMYQTCTVG